jgi:hypothetical protein
MAADPNLTEGKPVTLGATGGGQVALGPEDARGPAYWHVTGIILQTSRPNASPVPSAQIYLDSVAATNSQGLTSNGSFKTATCDITLARGQKLIAVWTGGQSGDIATLTLTGTKGNAP